LLLCTNTDWPETTAAQAIKTKDNTYLIGCEDREMLLILSPMALCNPPENI
jgi:hypothetical protein